MINRGYSKVRLSYELPKLKCPCCTLKTLDIKNIGFVKAKWKIRGLLNRKNNSKIVTEGRTYDHKLYTFKEMDYKKDWRDMEIEALKNSEEVRETKDPSLMNLPTPTDGKN